MESYRDIFTGAGFIPVAFEMEAQAFARAVVPKEEMGDVMVVDFGRSRTTFAIASDGKVQFATTINLAGEEIEKVFISHLKIDRSEVEKGQERHRVDKKKSERKTFESLNSIVSVIKNEALNKRLTGRLKTKTTKK